MGSLRESPFFSTLKEKKEKGGRVMSGIVFILSLAARLSWLWRDRPVRSQAQWVQRLRPWIHWILTGLATLAAITAAIVEGWWVFLAAGGGAVAPELWQGFRGLLKKPRTVAWLGGGLAALVALRNPQILGGVLTLGVIAFGIWTILGQPGRRQKRNNKK